MPNRKNNSRKGKNSGKVTIKKLETSQVNSLKTLVDLQVASQRAPRQVIADVPRMRMKRQKVYTFSTSVTGPNIMLQSTSDSDGAVSITFASLPAYGSLASVFDQYRIIQITTEFIPVAPPTASSTLYTVIDYDDSSATAITALLQYDTLRITPSNMFVERTAVPKVSGTLYGTATGYSVINPWIDVVSTTVPYYFLKYGLAQSLTVTSTTLAYTTVVTAIVSFRNIR